MAEVVDRRQAEASVAERQAQLVLELSLARLHHEELHPSPQERCEMADGEGPQRERPDQAGPDAALTQPAHRSLGHPRRRVGGHHDHFRVVGQEQVGALLGAGHALVLLVEPRVVRLEVRLGEMDRGDEVCAVGAVAVDGPRRNPRLDHRRGQAHPPGHLAEVAVREHHNGVAVLHRELEGDEGEVEHLLWSGGSEDDGVRVAMAQPAAGELDVALLRPDVAEPRPAPHHVHHDAGNLGSDHVGKALEHQAEAGRRGEGHGTQPAAPQPYM
jgi:hypothetical protein